MKGAKNSKKNNPRRSNRSSPKKPNKRHTIKSVRTVFQCSIFVILAFLLYIVICHTIANFYAVGNSWRRLRQENGLGLRYCNFLLFRPKDEARKTENGAAELAANSTDTVDRFGCIYISTFILQIILTRNLGRLSSILQRFCQTVATMMD